MAAGQAVNRIVARANAGRANAEGGDSGDGEAHQAADQPAATGGAEDVSGSLTEGLASSGGSAAGERGNNSGGSGDSRGVQPPPQQPRADDSSALVADSALVALAVDAHCHAHLDTSTEGRESMVAVFGRVRGMATDHVAVFESIKPCGDAKVTHGHLSTESRCLSFTE